MTGEEQLAAGFEAQRPYLRTLAFRVLGSHADAEDAVQEAWLRLARADGAGIDDLRAWLTTVTGRICLDVLRSRRTRSEQPLELSLGLLTAETTADPGVSPEDHVLLADSVGLALSVVMDALTPAERVSFVLHDVFEVPFDAIARILDRSTAATKMLASRARGRIRLGTPAAADQAAWKVVDAFLEAAGRGDVAGLLAVLAPEVEFRGEPSWRRPGSARRGRGRRPRRDRRGRGHARAPGRRGRHAGHPRRGRRTAGHGDGLLGKRRRDHRDPRAYRPGPARSDHPVLGDVTPFAH